MREIEVCGKKVKVGIMEDIARNEAENPEKYHDPLVDICAQYVKAPGSINAAELAAAALKFAGDEESTARLYNSQSARELARAIWPLARMAVELERKAEYGF